MRLAIAALLGAVALGLGLSACGSSTSTSGNSAIRVETVQVNGKTVTCVTYTGGGIDCDWGGK